MIFFLNFFRTNFFLALILITSAKIKPFSYTNKNHITTKSSTIPRFAIESGWYQGKRCSENKINCKTGLAIQANVFHSRTRNKRKMGQYFGLKQKNNISLGSGSNLGIDLETEDLIHKSINDGFTRLNYAGNDYTYHKPDSGNPRGSISYRPAGQAASNTDPKISSADFAIFLAALTESYQQSTDQNTLKSELSIAPEKHATGVLFSFFGNAKDNNLWCQLNLPLAKVKQTLNLKIDNISNFKGESSGRDVSTIQLLGGSYSFSSKTDPKDEQLALKYSKLFEDWKDDTQLIDPEIILGYRIINKDDVDLDLFTKFVIPSSKQSSPEFLFPVQIGNNGHFAMSFGASASADILKTKDSICAEIHAYLDLGYFFPATHARTYSSYSDRGVVLPWAKYSLFAKENEAGPVQPFANIGTIDTKVYPGFFTEANVALAVSFMGFSLDLGVGAFAKQAEKLDIEKWASDGLYGRVPPISYRTDMVYNAASFIFEGLDDSTTTKAELDLLSASTPEMLQTQCFAQLFYHTETPNPRGIGAGISYEWSNSNSSFDQISFWAKITASF